MYRQFFKAPHHLVESISGFCHSRWGVPDFDKVTQELTTWFATPLGQALLVEEKEALTDALQNQFGYFLLHMGVSDCQSMTETSRISHRFSLHPQAFENYSPAALADFNQLPLPNDSIDLVLLHHVLEFSQQPHQVLREASRVLIPRGHLIVVVFNPWSIWGWFGRLARLFSSKILWRHQYLGLTRMLDWLRLLEMEPVSVYRGYYRPPIQQPSLIEHLGWMEHWGKKLRFPRGGFYMLVARKDQIPLTLIRPRWQKEKPIKSMVVTRIIPESIPPIHKGRGHFLFVNRSHRE
jgi:SAM-dependent methyltransferase